jgi:PAS domain S-box-containing protein
MAESREPRLLLIDDHAQDRALASLVLGKAFPGASIREVDNAGDFAMRLREGSFDLVVTACRMKWMDGLGILRAVRESRPQVPVIAFSGQRDEEAVVDAMKAGFSDFVFKGSQGYLQLPEAVRETWEAARNRILAARSEPWLGTLLERSNIGVYRSTLDGRLVESTPALLRLLGVHEIEEALRVRLPEPHFLSEDREDLLARLRDGRNVVAREVEVHSADGPSTWLSLTEMLLLDVDDEMVVDVLVQDITRHKEREIELQATLRELERSNADLSQFAYMASHELQQPLRMVEKFGAILADDYAEDLGGDGIDLLRSVTDGAARMQSLVDDLLALSRIDTEGKDFVSVDSNEILHEAILGIEDLIDDSDASIRSDRLPVVVGDRFQLVQLWRNLISNAIKFRGEEAPKIDITAEETADSWVLSVADNGIGIDPQELDNIFVIFRRLHPELPGTGIGLSICRRIVERHGGRLWAEALPTQGTRFRFSMPKTGPASAKTEP